MFVGTVAGENRGTISNVHVLSGTVSGGIQNGVIAGGLVGQNEGLITKSGDGGFVETSSHQQLAFTGNVDTRAPRGATGTLLLDPLDFHIVQKIPPKKARQIQTRCRRQCSRSY